MISVSVTKNGNESTPSLLRRFSKRMQSSGNVRRAKSIRYHSRNISKSKRRMSALRRIARQEERAEKERAGLIQPTVRRGFRKN